MTNQGSKKEKVEVTIKYRREARTLKKVITTLMVAGTLFAGASLQNVEAASSFKDIQKHWAKSDIQQLASQKIMGGYEDGTFRPDKVISLAEYTSLLVRTLNLPPANGKYLPQPNKHWAAGNVEAAIEAGVISLEDVRKIGLDKSINRQIMTTMLVKGLKLKPSTAASPYTDVNNGYLTKAYEEYLVRGYAMGNERQFHTKETSTRAQAAAVIKRLIDYKKAPDAFKNVRKQADVKMVEGQTATSKWLKNLSAADHQKILNELKKRPSKVGFAGGKTTFDEAHAYSVENWARTPEKIQEFVDTAKGYNETRYTIDYRTVGDSYKNKLVTYLGGRMNYNNKELHPKDYADEIIKRAKNDKVIIEMHFITDPSMYYMDKDNRVNIRGRQYFVIRSGNKLAKSFGSLEIGQWYYSDVDVKLSSIFSNIAIDWERPEFTYDSMVDLTPSIKIK